MPSPKLFRYFLESNEREVVKFPYCTSNSTPITVDLRKQSIYEGQRALLSFDSRRIANYSFRTTAFLHTNYSVIAGNRISNIVAHAYFFLYACNMFVVYIVSSAQLSHSSDQHWPAKQKAKRQLLWNFSEPSQGPTSPVLFRATASSAGTSVLVHAMREFKRWGDARQ